MIIASGANQETGEQLIMLGLSSENVLRLLASQPITLSRRSHGDGIPDGWQIVIFHGETELAMQQLLERLGAIDDMTMIHVDPRLRS